jgi:hypothetical protein
VRGNTILLKQDNGSYQLLTISPAQPGQQMTQNITTSGSTIRLQTVPAVSDKLYYLQQFN